MILSTLSILILFLLFLGIGLLFPGSIFHKEQNFYTLLANFWTGWILTIAFLQIWHFFLPVGALAFLLVALTGAAGWLLRARSVLRYIRTWDLRTALVLAALCVVPALMLANHVMFAVPYSDHGLYHMQSVAWISKYAIVPGLGNLHHRLAFNNANFLYAALINWGPLQDRAYYVNNTLLGWVLIITCAAGFYHLFHSNGKNPQKHHLFYAILLPVAFNHLSSTHLPGYSPDVPNFILQVILAGELLRLVDSPTEPQKFEAQGLYMALLVAAGVVIKLAFAAFGALILLGLLLLWVRRYGFQWNSMIKLVSGWAGIGALLVIPWLARNVILSGYLLFPSMAVSFPVIWKMPEPLVEPIAPIIADWARTVSNSFSYTGDWDWFMKLWDRFPFLIRQTFLFTLAITAFDAVLYLVLLANRRSAERIRPDRHIRLDGGAGLLWGIAALSLVFWFEMAPDYRFSGAVFWLLLAAAILLGFQLLVEAGLVQSRLFLAASVLLALTIWLSPNHFSNNISRKWLFYPPPETEQAEQAQSLSNMVTKVTLSGLEIHMPPPPADQCWHLPLPCMPPADFTPKLRLIDPNNMQKGFYIPDW